MRLILQHEADRLGLPAGPDVGKDFLKNITNNKMTGDLFDILLARLNNRVDGEQLLADIASQYRINHVRQLLRSPLVTPYDVFRAYREQNERVAAKVAVVPVEKSLAAVPEPAASDIQALFEEYKDVLPDPARYAGIQSAAPDPVGNSVDRRQCPGPNDQG